MLASEDTVSLMLITFCEPPTEVLLHLDVALNGRGAILRPREAAGEGFRGGKDILLDIGSWNNGLLLSIGAVVGDVG